MAQVRSNLHEYYHQMGIHPMDYQCRHADTCKQYAHQGKFTETKMSLVGSLFGQIYPKILYVSLDPPLNVDKFYDDPKHRLVENISIRSEGRDYSKRRPNPHWAMIHIMTKDICGLWGYQGTPNSAVVSESYAGRKIENMAAYFAHVNITKCSMNNPGKAQSAREVHEICANEYLMSELVLLEPDIMISHGADANRLLGKMIVGQEVMESDLPRKEEITLGEKSVLWLPMHMPVRQLRKVREEWPFYMKVISEWKENSNSENQQESLESDYRLFRCMACGKMVMGYDRNTHKAEYHSSRHVIWKRVEINNG